MKVGKYNDLYMPSSHDYDKLLEKVKKYQADHKNRREKKDNKKPATKLRSNPSSFGSC